MKVTDDAPIGTRFIIEVAPALRKFSRRKRMIINQDEHDNCFFKIYKSTTVKNLDFLRCRNIDITEAREKAFEMMDFCTKVIFLAQKFEENDIDGNDNDVIDKWIGGL